MVVDEGGRLIGMISQADLIKHVPEQTAEVLRTVQRAPDLTWLVDKYRTLSAPFVITGYTFTDVPVVVASLSDGAATGCGEAAGVYYLGDDVEHSSDLLERDRRAGDRQEHVSGADDPSGY